MLLKDLYDGVRTGEISQESFVSLVSNLMLAERSFGRFEEINRLESEAGGVREERE